MAHSSEPQVRSLSNPYPPPPGAQYPRQQPYSPPGGFHYAEGNPPPTIVTYPANTTVVVQPATHVHSNVNGYVILSCIVFWCCNVVFGFIAFIMAISARNAMQEGDLQYAKTLGKWSLWLSVVGVVFTVVVVLVLVILLFTGVIWNAAFDGAYYIP